MSNCIRILAFFLLFPLPSFSAAGQQVETKQIFSSLSECHFVLVRGQPVADGTSSVTTITEEVTVQQVVQYATSVRAQSPSYKTNSTPLDHMKFAQCRVVAILPFALDDSAPLAEAFLPGHIQVKRDNDIILLFRHHLHPGKIRGSNCFFPYNLFVVWYTEPEVVGISHVLPSCDVEQSCLVEITELDQFDGPERMQNISTENRKNFRGMVIPMHPAHRAQWYGDIDPRPDMVQFRTLRHLERKYNFTFGFTTSQTRPCFAGYIGPVTAVLYPTTPIPVVVEPSYVMRFDMIFSESVRKYRPEELHRLISPFSRLLWLLLLCTVYAVAGIILLHAESWDISGAVLVVMSPLSSYSRLFTIRKLRTKPYLLYAAWCVAAWVLGRCYLSSINYQPSSTERKPVRAATPRQVNFTLLGHKSVAFWVCLPQKGGCPLWVGNFETVEARDGDIFEDTERDNVAWVDQDIMISVYANVLPKFRKRQYLVVKRIRPEILVWWDFSNARNADILMSGFRRLLQAGIPSWQVKEARELWFRRAASKLGFSMKHRHRPWDEDRYIQEFFKFPVRNEPIAETIHLYFYGYIIAWGVLIAEVLTALFRAKMLKSSQNRKNSQDVDEDVIN